MDAFRGLLERLGFSGPPATGFLDLPNEVLQLIAQREPEVPRTMGSVNVRLAEATRRAIDDAFRSSMRALEQALSRWDGRSPFPVKEYTDPVRGIMRKWREKWPLANITYYPTLTTSQREALIVAYIADRPDAIEVYDDDVQWIITAGQSTPALAVPPLKHLSYWALLRLCDTWLVEHTSPEPFTPDTAPLLWRVADTLRRVVLHAFAENDPISFAGMALVLFAMENGIDSNNWRSDILPTWWLTRTMCKRVFPGFEQHATDWFGDNFLAWYWWTGKVKWPSLSLVVERGITVPTPRQLARFLLPGFPNHAEELQRWATLPARPGGGEDERTLLQVLEPFTTLSDKGLLHLVSFPFALGMNWYMVPLPAVAQPLARAAMARAEQEPGWLEDLLRDNHPETMWTMFSLAPRAFPAGVMVRALGVLQRTGSLPDLIRLPCVYGGPLLDPTETMNVLIWAIAGQEQDQEQEHPTGLDSDTARQSFGTHVAWTQLGTAADRSPQYPRHSLPPLEVLRLLQISHFRPNLPSTRYPNNLPLLLVERGPGDWRGLVEIYYGSDTPAHLRRDAWIHHLFVLMMNGMRASNRAALPM